MPPGIAESSLTVSDLFKAKAVTEDDVDRLVKTLLDGKADKASDFASRVLGAADRKSETGRNRQAIALSRKYKCGASPTLPRNTPLHPQLFLDRERM